MKNYPYSYTTRIQRISQIFYILILFTALISVLLCFGIYNQTITTWIVSNKVNNSITITQSETNPIIGNSSVNETIPYQAIFFDNIGFILLFPLTFISFTIFLLQRTYSNLIQREINELFKIIGIKKISSEKGVIKINEKNNLYIKINEKGLFILETPDSTIYVSGDELYWKTKYFKFIYENS